MRGRRIRAAASSTVCGLDGAERRHHDRELAQLVVVEQAPDLAAVLLAEREHQHRGALRPGQLFGLRRSRCLAAGQASAIDAGDLVRVGCFALRRPCRSVTRSSRRLLVQPLTDDGDGFVRVALGELADLLHRLGVDLALHLGDVDQRSAVPPGRIAPGAPGPAALAAPSSTPRRPARTPASRRPRRSSAARMRFDQRPRPPRTARPGRAAPSRRARRQCMMSSLVNCSMPRKPVGSAIGVAAGASAKRRLTTSTWSPRFWSKPIARAHQRGDAVELLLGARLVGQLALVVLGVDAVDQHRDRDAVDAAALGHLGLGGAGNLVIDDFLGLLALVARRGGRAVGCCWPPGSSLSTVTWPSVVGGRAADSSRVWLERSTRPSGSNLSEVWVMRLKSKSAESCTRARPGPTTEETIVLDLLAQPLLVGELALVGAEPPAPVRRRAPSASSAPVSSTIETRCGFRPLTAEATRWRMARTCCGLERAAHLEHDRGRGLGLVAREQRTLGQHEVHARGLHPVDGADGARQLAFERAQVVDVLHESWWRRARPTCRRSRSRRRRPWAGRPRRASCAAAAPCPWAPSRWRRRS